MKNKYILLSLLTAFAALPATPALGAQYAYHPEARLYLRGGFNPFTPDRAYIGCIDDDGEEQVETEGAVGSDVGISLVTSREDLYQKINFSASLSGSYTFYKASGSVRYEDEQAFHSDSLTWVVFFKSNYGHFVLKNPRLKKSMERASADQLYETCGPEIVTERKKGVMLFALLTVRNLSQSRRTEFEAKLSGSASGAIWSASMDMQYKKILRSAMASSDISIRIHALGGRGVTDLTDILKSTNDSPFVAYEKMPGMLENYLKQMTKANAAPTQYVTTHLKSFANRLPLKFDNFKSGQVGTLFNKYLGASTIVARIDQILMSSEDSFDMTAEDRTRLAEARSKYEDNMNMIFASAQKCFDVTGQCSIPRTTDVTFRWPSPRMSNSQCEDLRRYVRERGLINDEIYEMARRRNFAPILEPGTGKLEGWQSCAELGRGH